MKKFFLLCLAVLGFVACTPDEERIDLSGVWQFALDREGLVKPGDAMSDTIVLPGTTDTNRKGDPIEWKGFVVSAALSPFIWQKPPIGNQFKDITKPSPGIFFHCLRGMRFHLPSTLRQQIALGGKQMPNSSTSTPFFRAIKKCPNSCAVTRHMSINKPIITPTNTLITL